MEEKERIEKIKELLGKINLGDIDRDEDLMWFVADLWCLEKHISTSLYMLNEKLKNNPEDESEFPYQSSGPSGSYQPIYRPLLLQDRKRHPETTGYLFSG